MRVGRSGEGEVRAWPASNSTGSSSTDASEEETILCIEGLHVRVESSTGSDAGCEGIFELSGTGAGLPLGSGSVDFSTMGSGSGESTNFRLRISGGGNAGVGGTTSILASGAVGVSAFPSIFTSAVVRSTAVVPSSGSVSELIRSGIEKLRKPELAPSVSNP